MRTLALALAAASAVWLAPPAAEAVCTSGVDCIRERFGTNPMPRNNRIIDRTDGLGDRNRPVNPYLARQGLRVAPGNRTIYAPTGDQEAALETLQPNQIRPDAGAAAPSVGSALGPARVIGPGTQPGDAAAQPYAPAAAATGPATGATTGQTGAWGRDARPAPRDPNQPYAGAQPPGVNR